jgi:hypothetical protein
MFIQSPFLVTVTIEYRKKPSNKYYYTHLSVSAIYSAQCGGIFIQKIGGGKNQFVVLLRIGLNVVGNKTLQAQKQN